MELAKIEVKPDEELKAAKTQDRTRDDTQKEVDTEVEATVKAWDAMKGAAHRATVPVDKRPRLRFASDNRTELLRVIRRAATLHKVAPHFYAHAEDAKGRHVVTFTLDNPKPKTH
jgi:hypothetical protein